MQFLAMLIVAASISPPSDAVLVKAVISGDTINVAAFGRVHLLGVEAPKLARGLTPVNALAARAKAFLEGLLLHRYVRLEWDSTDSTPRAGRRGPAYVMTEDGQFVNALIVDEGFARVSSRAAVSRLDELQRAEAEAQALRKGIWSVADAQPPGDTRRPRR